MPFNLGRPVEYSSTGKQHQAAKYLVNFFESYSKKYLIFYQLFRK